MLNSSFPFKSKREILVLNRIHANTYIYSEKTKGGRGGEIKGQ